MPPLELMSIKVVQAWWDIVRLAGCQICGCWVKWVSWKANCKSPTSHYGVGLTDSSFIDLQHQARLVPAGWQILIISNCCLLVEACWRTVAVCFLLFSSQILLGVIHTSHSLPFDSPLAGSSAWGSPNKASMQASISIMPLNGLWPTSWSPRAKTRRRCGTMQCPIVWCLTPMEPPCFLSSRSRPWALTWNLGWPNWWLWWWWSFPPFFEMDVQQWSHSSLVTGFQNLGWLTMCLFPRRRALWSLRFCCLTAAFAQVDL